MDLSLLNLSKLSTPHIVQPCISSGNSRPLSNSTNCINFPEPQNLGTSDSEDGIALIKTHTPIVTPKSETDSQISFFHSVSSTFFDLNRQISFDTEPKLDAVSPKDFNQIFTKKCFMCCQMCNFNDEKMHIEEKAQKTEILEDILSHMKNNVISLLTDAEYKIIYKMFIKNIIRTTPDPPDSTFSLINSDMLAERVEEVAWPHMSLVYDILTALFTSDAFNSSYCHEEVIKITNTILKAFMSPDLRERGKLIKLFHAFYKACNKQRNLLRNNVASFFNMFNNSPYPIVGVNEVATVLVPILSGLKVPLHSEHRTLYTESILPLHKSSFALQFHAPLLAIAITMCTKDPSLVITTIKYLDNHWPQTLPTKEVLFLTEIENLLPLIKSAAVIESTAIITRIVAMCVKSSEFAVSERALMMWKNEMFAKLIISYSKLTFPVILPALFRTANEHWCSSVCSLAIYVLRSLKGSDFPTFNDVGAHMRQVESEKILREMEKGYTWKRFINKYVQNDKEKSDAIAKVGQIFIGSEIVSPTISQKSSCRDRKVDVRQTQAVKNVTTAKDPVIAPRNKTKRQSLGRSVLVKQPLSAFRHQKRLSDFATAKNSFLPGK